MFFYHCYVYVVLTGATAINFDVVASSIVGTVDLYLTVDMYIFATTVAPTLIGPVH